jgi:hypothetical protein
VVGAITLELQDLTLSILHPFNSHRRSPIPQIKAARDEPPAGTEEFGGYWIIGLLRPGDKLRKSEGRYKNTVGNAMNSKLSPERRRPSHYVWSSRPCVCEFAYAYPTISPDSQTGEPQNPRGVAAEATASTEHHGGTDEAGQAASGMRSPGDAEK